MKMEEQVFFFDLTQDQFKTWGKTEIFDEIWDYFGKIEGLGDASGRPQPRPRRSRSCWDVSSLKSAEFWQLNASILFLN